MKKSILVLLVATSFITCSKNKNNLSPIEPEVSAQNSKLLPAAAAAAPTTLCYVTYNAASGMSYLVKFTASTGAVTFNMPITGLAAGERVLGGIARRKNTLGAYEYFITTASSFGASVPVNQKRINLLTAATGLNIVICLTGNTIADYKNYLLENAPSFNYYYRTAGTISKGTTSPVLCGTPIATGLFSSLNGSICFGALNISGTGYANANSGSSSGQVYKNTTFPSVPSPFPVWGAPNSYVSTIAASSHCLTVDDLLNGTMYLAYNGSYAGGFRTIIASGLISAGTFPLSYTANFPSGTGGGFANITDIEAVY
jgi:hypothetical protein